ncbi:putative isochorismatase family protein YaaI [Porphyridium purpureum]|uniref:Putative isochorismatase family protein YaaI n=1 Tax=Porphyridium purpureum TaxID=35688 RepID=A0A5J4YR78_PORPP|nr:putative isochorismatase family protein YaaI [Porphyridium purpureum]|eukprot:POR2418..scf222_8
MSPNEALARALIPDCSLEHISSEPERGVSAEAAAPATVLAKDAQAESAMAAASETSVAPRLVPVVPRLPALRSRHALLVVDVQQEYWSLNAQIRGEFPEFAPNIARLLELARRDPDCVVVHIRAVYDDGARSRMIPQFVALNPNKMARVDGIQNPEPFAAALPNEMVIAKPVWDAFHDTALHEYLTEMGVSHVLVCGLVTSACVQHTAHGAFCRGYGVTLVEDCCADRTRQQHDMCFALYTGYMWDAVKLRDLQQQFDAVCACTATGDCCTSTIHYDCPQLGDRLSAPTQPHGCIAAQTLRA